MRPRPVEQRPIGERRREILAAAAGLFAERGYRGVSIDDIGRAIGTTGPALYRHFPGKRALLGEVLLDISRRLSRRGSVLLARSTEPRDALDLLLRGHISFALDEPSLIVVHDRELHHLTDEDNRRVRRIQRRYVEEWVTVLAELRPDEPREVLLASTQAAFGLLNSTPHSHVLPRGEMAALLLRMGTAALLPDRPVEVSAHNEAHPERAVVPSE
ncbi:TetR/AcrR family transcriptional regulator [Nocardiopsis lambiniae]|uniref:TetR/AcrR family transcriptional regulator n=1 Tax=Nocardiopsis lambiniae TaxID=3075539 RepID=A0ABU2M7P2_9ACTN|nr:TetR/AcrR family transcriptional regulator [Nocardiopsis sp. DSM 44743]MDT0328682.1 TetR/AcrR family transcriptional regulator [Nocardiopsis sp. DSM 44743]